MNDLHPKQFRFTRNIAHLINFAIDNGFELSFGEAYRTEYQQQEYLRRGLSKTMDSRHLQRLAVDFNIFKDGILLNNPNEIKPLGDYWVELHEDNVWGGDWNRNSSILDETFKDPYHFEMKP